MILRLVGVLIATTVITSAIKITEEGTTIEDEIARLKAEAQGDTVPKRAGGIDGAHHSVHKRDVGFAEKLMGTTGDDSSSDEESSDDKPSDDKPSDASSNSSPENTMEHKSGNSDGTSSNEDAGGVFPVQPSLDHGAKGIGSMGFKKVVNKGVLGGAKHFKNVRVKFGIWPHGYNSVPIKPKEADNFVFAAKDKTLNVELYSYKKDPRFFLMADRHGHLAGIRIGYIPADLPKRAKQNKLDYKYNFKSHKIFHSGRFWSTKIYYADILFVDPDKLKEGGRSKTDGIMAEDVYLQLEGDWVKIPRDECQVEKLGFTRQGCIPGMGLHYFYKVTPEMDCTEFNGVFLLYESGELVGLGLVPFGTFSSKKRVWFEDPPASVIKMIVPNGPQCFPEWVADYGVSSMHVFFKSHPRTTACIWPFQKSKRCSKSPTKGESAAKEESAHKEESASKEE